MTFKEEILQGIPAGLPEAKPYDKDINHAPKRKDILSSLVESGKLSESTYNNIKSYISQRSSRITAASTCTGIGLPIRYTRAL